MATEAFEEIFDDFLFLDDWEDRYRYIVDLGRTLDPMNGELKTALTKVDGCASQVWIMPEILEREGCRQFRFRGDSDAMIVRGLIAILIALYNDLRVEEVGRVDTEFEFERLGLRSHLSSQRSNGLTSMVERIRELARREPTAAVPEHRS